MGVGQLIRNVITTETDPTVASFTKSLTSNNTILTAVNAASGTISASVLPSYIDDVLNFANLAAFPVAGETSKIYVDETTNKVYRWSGSVYVEISSSATAGEALKLTNARTISTTGDITGSISGFDGSADVSGVMTLQTVNSNVGSFGSVSAIPVVTVNAKGQVTAVSTNSIGNELIAIQALSDTPGFLKKTGDGTYSIDINSYLPLTGGTVTGDLVSTSATTSTSTTTGAITAASLGVTGAIFANTVSANSYNLIPVGRGGGNVSTNTAVGVNAGYSNTTGTNNSFVGRNAGYSNTTGTSNSFVGRDAGYSNTTGNNNSFVGRDAGVYIADGVTGLTISNNSCFFGMNTKGTQNATNENVFCYNTTGNGSNTVTIGDNNIVRTYLKGVVDVANTTPSTSTTTGASIVVGGQGIGGNQHIGGFTSLGGDASHPAVKFMELSGTTAASQGGVALIAHGLNSAKIKAINVLVSNVPSNYVTPGLVSTAGYQFDVAIGVTQILITNIAANSYNILNKPIVVTVFYIA